MHVRTHADHFPPSNIMLIFHQPIIIPCLPHNYEQHVVDIDDSSNMFGENYKYYRRIVVNCPKQRNTGKEKK